MNTMNILVLLLFVSLLHLSCQGEAPRVVTKSGPVVGKSTVTETGKNIYSYYSIPYIKPPIKDLRFKPPQPVEPWTKDLRATKDTIMCSQKVIGPVMGSEDCVVLSVHTPRAPAASDTPLPVMVFIHGGGFVLGSSIPGFSGQPDYLVEHEVVLVMVNYRLGILGFLSTEDAEAPGNYGLLDQVEGLRWVRDNIAAFGGNPDDVTIFGESAGSASVHMHMLSPLSKGLFHRVIAQSGTALNPWATTKLSKTMAIELAKKAKCPHTTSAEMIECLRNMEASQLVGLDVIEEKEKHGNIPFIWSPRIDSESPTPFLPEHPTTLMETGRYHQVPILIGHTSLEGGMFMNYPRLMGSKLMADLEHNWDKSCNTHMAFKGFLTPEDTSSKWCASIKERYINSEKSFQDSLMDYASALGDGYINAPIYKTTELMSKHSDIYSYVFDYDSEKISYLGILMGQLGAPAKVKGNVAHADDLIYLFKYPQARMKKGSLDYGMMETMTKIWTEFAKTGVPPIPTSNESWPKASGPNPKYVVIDTTQSIGESYDKENMEFYHNIFSNTLYKVYGRTKDEL